MLHSTVHHELPEWLRFEREPRFPQGDAPIVLARRTRSFARDPILDSERHPGDRRGLPPSFLHGGPGGAPTTTSRPCICRIARSFAARSGLRHSGPL